MASTPITLTGQQLTAIVQERYPNVVVTGIERAYQQSNAYGTGTTTYVVFGARPKLDASNPIWTSADGRQTAVREMAVTHVQNALAKVIRNDYGYSDSERQFWINAFVKRLAQ